MTYDREKLKQELRRDEGLRLEAYKDTVGKWTIGVGHLLGDSMRMEKITIAEAMALLERDVLDAEDALDASVPFWKTLDPVRQRVLVNMSFNLGGRLAGFVNFKVKLAKGQFIEASAEMLDSKWAKQVGARAERLAKTIEKGSDV